MATMTIRPAFNGLTLTEAQKVGHVPYQKPNETEARAIKRMRANRRLQLSRAGSGQQFPTWKPGMTTADYVRMCGISRPQMLPIDMARLGNREAPWNDEPETVDQPYVPAEVQQAA